MGAGGYFHCSVLMEEVDKVERSKIGGWGVSRESCLSGERGKPQSIVFGCQVVPIVSKWETKYL